MRIGYSTTNYIWNDLTKSFAENKWKWQIWSICKEKESRLWTCNSLNPCLCSVVQTTEGSVRSDIEGLFSSFQKFPLLSFSCLRLLSQAQPTVLWNSQETFGLKLGSHLVPLTACVFVGTFMWQAIGKADEAFDLQVGCHRLPLSLRGAPSVWIKTIYFPLSYPGSEVKWDTQTERRGMSEEKTAGKKTHFGGARQGPTSEGRFRFQVQMTHGHESHRRWRREEERQFPCHRNSVRVGDFHATRVLNAGTRGKWP